MSVRRDPNTEHPPKCQADGTRSKEPHPLVTTANDLASLNAHLSSAEAHLANGTDLVLSNPEAAQINLAAAVFDIAYAQIDAKNLAADVAPQPTPPPSGSVGFGQQPMPLPTGSRAYAASDLVFHDAFSGTSLDLTKWWPRIGAQGSVWDNRGQLACPHSGANTPLGNGQDEAQIGTPSQISVNNGLTFSIDPRPNAAPYNTAPYNEYLALGCEMTTYNVAGSDCTGSTAGLTLPNTGWYVQMLAKLPDMQNGVMGVNLWFLEPDGDAPEIDVVQPCFGVQQGAQGSAINRFPFGIGYLNGANGGNQAVPDVGGDVTQAFHVYGVEWIPGRSLTMYFDGEVVYTRTSAQVGGGGLVQGNYEIIMEGAVWLPGLGFTTGYDGSSAKGQVAEIAAYRF
jgi:hypothetical protein